MLVVLDTNVLVSSLLNPFGKPAAILGLVLEEKVTICYDSRIISEYMDVLHRSKFRFPTSEISELIDFLRETGTSYAGNSDFVKATHTDDLPFAQISLAAHAEYLITGNTSHFPEHIGDTKVVTPADFLDKFYSGKTP